MVADPCNARVVPGLYGSESGMLAKVKSSLVLPTDATATCGYVMWDPDYHELNTGLGAGSGNLFRYSSDLSSTQPSNTVAFPFGAGDAAPAFDTTAFTLSDPAAALLAGTTVADARALSACMQLTYTGRLLDASGEICFITNLPAHTLLNGGAGGNPLSVNEIFTYAPHKARLTPSTQEVVFRPQEHSDTYRAETDSLFVYNSGVAATVVAPTAEVLAPIVIGFAWRGVFAGNLFSLDITKNIEWRAEPSTGISQSKQVSHGASKVPAVTAVLDNHPSHHWAGPTDMIGSAAKQILGGLGRGSVGKSIGGAVSSVMPRIIDAGVGYIEGQAQKAIMGIAGDVLAGEALPMLEMLPFLL